MNKILSSNNSVQKYILYFLQGPEHKDEVQKSNRSVSEVSLSSAAGEREVTGESDSQESGDTRECFVGVVSITAGLIFCHFYVRLVSLGEKSGNGTKSKGRLDVMRVGSPLEVC